ncbi:MAG: hypothetical protein WCY47_00175 [Pusillimonas sp.]
MNCRQRGFALFELIVAALIATLLAVWASEALVRKAQEASAQAVAVWMEGVKDALAHYLIRHAASLREATAPGDLEVTGYADWRTPTLAELKGDGLLSVGYPEVYGRDLRLATRVLPQGVCPGDTCAFEAVVYLTSPLDLAIMGRPGDAVLAAWLLAAQGHGGLVARADQSRLAGASFAYVNPPDPEMTALAPGVVALAVTQAGGSAFPYLKVGDERDPLFSAALTVAGTIKSGSGVRAQSSLWLGTQAVAMTSCPENGLVVREQFGGMLVCRSYLWRSAGGRGGGGYSVNSVSGCLSSASNPITGGCSCPSGYSLVLISDSGPKADAEGRTRGYLCAG